jgi:hypothetical protein
VNDFLGHSLPEEDVKKFESDGGNILIATPGRIEKCLGLQISFVY